MCSNPRHTDTVKAFIAEKNKALIAIQQLLNVTVEKGKDDKVSWADVAIMKKLTNKVNDLLE